MDSDAFLERLPTLASAMGMFALEADRVALEVGHDLTRPQGRRSVAGNTQHYADHLRPALWHDIFVSSEVAEEYGVHVVDLDRARRHHYTCDMTHLFSIFWRKGTPSPSAPLAYGLRVPAELTPVAGNKNPFLIPVQPWRPLIVQFTLDAPTPTHPLITIRLADKENPHTLITLTRNQIEDAITPTTVEHETPRASPDYPYRPGVTLTPPAEPDYAQPYLFGA